MTGMLQWESPLPMKRYRTTLSPHSDIDDCNECSGEAAEKTARETTYQDLEPLKPLMTRYHETLRQLQAAKTDKKAFELLSDLRRLEQHQIFPLLDKSFRVRESSFVYGVVDDRGEFKDVINITMATVHDSCWAWLATALVEWCKHPHTSRTYGTL